VSYENSEDMRQPTLTNRKPQVFARCPVCGTEFRSTANQRWCSRDCLHAAKQLARRIAALEGPPFVPARADVIWHQVDAAAGWRLVRRPTHKDRP
jgi:hypothetical protein